MRNWICSMSEMLFSRARLVFRVWNYHRSSLRVEHQPHPGLTISLLVASVSFLGFFCDWCSFPVFSVNTLDHRLALASSVYGSNLSAFWARLCWVFRYVRCSLCPVMCCVWLAMETTGADLCVWPLRWHESGQAVIAAESRPGSQDRYVGRQWQAGPAATSGAQCLLPQDVGMDGQGSPWYLL